MDKLVHIDPRAEKVLGLLTGKPEVSEIVLGGYFVLQRYIAYRRTHDIDAWWKTRANPDTERAIREAMGQVAEDEGCQLLERRFGETVSFELARGNRKGFSFQIAVRSIGLEVPELSDWPPILIESLADNLGSKMNALVDRGAPRDFTDIQHAIRAGLVTVDGAWELWRRKNPDQALDAAKQKVMFHLSSLESRRPLEAIRDPAELEAARITRLWYMQEFLRR